MCLGKFIIMCNVGKPLGDMDGLTYAVKDNLTTKSIPTTCGSRFLKGNHVIVCTIRVFSIQYMNLYVVQFFILYNTALTKMINT